MASSKRLIDNTFFYGLASYLEYFLGLIITTIIARSLGAEQYGIYSFILWLSAFGVALLSDGLGVTAIRFLAELRGEGRNDLVRPLVAWLVRLLLIATLPVALLLLLVYGITADRQMPGYYWVAAFVIASFIPKAINIFYVNVAKGIEEYSTQFRINLLVNPFNLAAVSLVALLGGGVREFVFAYLLVSLAYALASWWLVSARLADYPRAPAPRFREQGDVGQVSRSVKLMTLTLFLGFVVEKQLEVFVLNFYQMPTEAGLYNAGFILGVSAMGLVPGVLSGIILPVMARAGADGADAQAHKYREFSRYLVLLAVPLVCYGVALSVEIIELVFGAEYSRSAIAFAIVLVASGVTIMVHSANSVLLTRDMQHKMLKGVAIGAVINIVIDFAAIPLYGLWGALAGFITTLLFISAYNIRMASHALGTTLEWGYYLRVFTVGVIVATPFLLLKNHFPPALSIFVGGALYVGLFLAGLFLAGLIRDQDREVLRYLSSRVPVLNRIVTA